LTGCVANYRRDDAYTDEDVSSGTDIGEEKVDLSTVNVQVTEEDYQQMKEIREELKNVILNKADSQKLSQLIEQIPTETNNPKESDPWPNGSCYLSSIPLIEWDCQKNNIYDIKLPVFSKDMSEFNFLIVNFSDGKINYESGGYESIDLEIWQKDPDKKYVLLKADFYKSCMIDQNNRIYLEENLVTIPEHFCDRFDFDQVGVSLNEATASDACIKVDLGN